jgi:hypothetical protein
MLTCPSCTGHLKVRQVECPACELRFSGDFELPRLLRLSGRSLALAEGLILAGGNLKALAESLGVSYPTVRKRVDDLITELEALRAGDQNRINEILRGMETGKISSARGTRMIKELNGTG